MRQKGSLVLQGQNNGLGAQRPYAEHYAGYGLVLQLGGTENEQIQIKSWEVAGSPATSWDCHSVGIKKFPPWRSLDAGAGFVLVGGIKS